MTDFLFRGKLSELDPEVYELIQIEAERQYKRLILIPSESTAPIAVRDTLSSAFNNIYAEGYPSEVTRKMEEDEILDFTARLSHYRRYSDPRYYKGVEYADIVEALARHRCAQAFAANGIHPNDIFVNVQPLSGAPANNAVYHALVQPGDTVMGMNLLHGGHLSHGSPVNRSGKLYNIVHYTVNSDDEKLDYDAIADIAREHQPKMIIAGYSSYPWTVDWDKFKLIADEVGAYLLADIAHVAGLVVAGAFPSPLGFADVVTFTTHKSLCGPRGACILTTQESLARKIDRAVFPGEQGGPHVNVFAGLALTFKLAQSEQFNKLQHQIVKNCQAMTNRLEERGFRIPYGGTNTHLMNLDCHSIVGDDDVPLSGDMAARILDITGIVVNRNTIPGDKSARDPSGIRMGSTWVTQRGFTEPEMIELADVIADVLLASKPYTVFTKRGGAKRAKVDFGVLEKSKLKIRDLALTAGIDFQPQDHEYPHFFYIDDYKETSGERTGFKLSGDQVRAFLNAAVSSDVEDLKPGKNQATIVYTPDKEIEGTLTCIDEFEFQLSVSSEDAGLVSAWLRNLSDGYIVFGDDLHRKLAGPIYVTHLTDSAEPPHEGEPIAHEKPYYIGISKGSGEALPDFQWTPDNNESLLRTPIFKLHKELGAKMVPFAGWEMPVWYSSVVEEHQAVRNNAGLFDVTHMGVYQAQGPDAAIFLDSVCANDIHSLKIGESLYTQFLDPDANVIDDLLVYRRSLDAYLVVVNAANDDKDWAWLNAVRDGIVCVDRERSWSRAYGRGVVLKNLRDPAEGKDMRVDIALQGPRSRDILLSLDSDDETRKRIMSLKRTHLCEADLGGFALIVSRTGYTGESMAFELFIHPDQSAKLFATLLEVGKDFGIKPCGLGSRDSLRTEAGLPLYGHEMGGDLNLGVGEAGFGAYVKTHKPWFIGRSTYLARERERDGIVVRFRFNEKGVRVAHLGDPVLDKRGRVIGKVTSCAVDQDGTLTGQAYVTLKHTKRGTPISIIQSASTKAGKPPADLTTGDRFTVPSAATVLRRFP